VNLNRLLLVVILAGPAIAMGGSVRVQNPSDPVKTLVERLDLEKYKATIRELTVFGDRQQGTARNRDAIDWIEAQLKTYGCTNTERLTYMFPLPLNQRRTGAAGNEDGRVRGFSSPTGVNRNPEAQQNPRLRELNSGSSANGSREEVYCTKVGVTHPEEMYIVGAHMDGLGFGEAANDDASGTALVMELARVFSSPDVQTERSIRFILFNNEETSVGQGSAAYVAQRELLQGREDPPGSGRYPEPRWLGMIQHDMMLFDHGMPRSDGTVSPEQRPEADINIEFYSGGEFGGVFSPFAAGAQTLAWAFQRANEKYATRYPASVGSDMGATDSASFISAAPAISLRENERIAQIGGGWNPHWHQPTDVFSAYDDKDFNLGLNAAQTTMGAVGNLARVTLKR